MWPQGGLQVASTPFAPRHGGARPRAPVAYFPIPTGLHPSARGCEARATLGQRAPKISPTPAGLHLCPAGDSRPGSADSCSAFPPQLINRLHLKRSGEDFVFGQLALSRFAQAVSEITRLQPEPLAYQRARGANRHHRPAILLADDGLRHLDVIGDDFHLVVIQNGDIVAGTLGFPGTCRDRPGRPC